MFALAWGNLIRRPLRTALTVSSLALAVAVLLFGRMLTKALESH